MSSEQPKAPVPAWIGLPLIVGGVVALIVLKPDPGAEFRRRSEDTRQALIRAMSPIPEVPTSPGNAFADEPAAARLGQALFFDKGLSSNGEVSCATCHQPKKHFTDGLKTAMGVGRDDRCTPTVIGAQHTFGGSGMVGADSQWAQALGPLESPIEHNLSRLAVYRRVKAAHVVRYTEAFGALPESEVLAGAPMNASPRSDEVGQRAWAQLPAGERRVVEQVFVHVGKALEAYQRQLKPGETPVDRYVAALNAGDRLGGGALSPSAVRGMSLFVGKAKCSMCHSGPLLTDHSFHNLGLPSQLATAPCATERRVQTETGEQIEWNTSGCGLRSGARTGAAVLTSEFRCGGAPAIRPSAGSQASQPDFADFVGAFTPSLRDVEKTAPYMHTGEFDTLEEVLSCNTMPGTVRMGHRGCSCAPFISSRGSSRTSRVSWWRLARSRRIRHGISRWSRCEPVSSVCDLYGRLGRRGVGLVLSWLLAGRPLACHERAEASL